MKYFFIFLCVIINLKISAQAPSKFYQRFGGNGYDVGYDVKQTLDSGYIITGSTSSFGAGYTDMYLAKLDKMGQVKFQKTFGNYNNENGKSVVQLIDSSYVMLGYTNSTGFGGYDMYLVKADKTGAFLWQKNYGGVDWDFGNSLQQTSDGGFIIAGTTYSFGRGNADGYVIKTDALGNVTWTKTYGGANDDEFKSVIQTSDGGYALTGYSKSYGDTSFGDLWAFKLNALGDSTWCKFFGGVKEDFGNCILEHPNGDFFISGAKQSIATNLLEGYALRINNLGTLVFQVLDGNLVNNQVFSSIVVSKKNNNIVTVIEKENFPGYKLQFKIMELNLALAYLNATDYGSTEDDETFSVISTFDKGYASIGYTTGFNAILTDVYLVKTDSLLMGGTFSIVGISEYENDKIQIFPNPVSQILTFKGKNNILNISLFDSFGNEIEIIGKTIQKSNEGFKIDVSHLSNGFYFLKIDNTTKKIMIIH